MFENNCSHALNYVKQFGKLDNKKECAAVARIGS